MVHHTTTRVLGKRDRAPIDLDIQLVPLSSSPVLPDAVVDTRYRARLLTLNKQFGGKITKSKLSEAANITNERIGYRILTEGTTSRCECIKNRGRPKTILNRELKAIETVEDSSFQMRILPHQVVADCVGASHNKSERTVQRNMADFGVGTYVAAQGKWLT